MAERIPCEFFLIRYVPDVVKGEFTNIGVMLREAGREESTVVRFTRDWSRVRCMDADADLGLLEALESDLGERLRAAGGDTGPVLAQLEDSLSNSVQMAPAGACLAESVVTEMELLMRLYVEPIKVKVEKKKTGRAAIAGALRTHFERAGVWAAMRKRISASIYTMPGDPLKIDCGYRPNGVIKMFQAVSLEADVESAKVLAYSAPHLREGVRRVEGARLELTAIVEPLRAVAGEIEGGGSSESEDRYRFGVSAMERQEIRVLTVADLARVAETARVDLRL